ncbi:unnamed protein product [Calypogeia fissa]
MAAILAALGFTSSKKVEETPPARKSIALAIAETSSQTVLYMDKVAKDIVSASPIFGKARVPIIARHHDNESLLVEIIDLKKVLEETETHLHMHKQYYWRLLEDSRKLEREVEELELRGNYDAPRTGGVVRLESRYKGLGAQIDVLEDVVAERKYGELSLLRKDLGATHTRETEVERDTVAAEIMRLRILLDHMESLYKELKELNNHLKFRNRQLPRLGLANPKVQQQIDAKKTMIQQAREEIERLKKAGEDALERMKELAEKDEILEKQITELSPKAQAARLEKRKLANKNNQLAFDRMIFNQDFRKAHPGILLA